MKAGSVVAQVLILVIGGFIGFGMIIPLGHDVYGSHPTMGMTFLAFAALAGVTLANEENG